ncbi:dihydrolipoamide acetyltransferase family protein [Henriciella sp.]|uniref:dihydrolipoamide acetyltransferase family protein n=1 Tax=Henriciella sp. TaxID=1968823 RepID=UPI00261004CD|nr:dihydrolipoamide acetyltransferase family protein [Henriciella sp.]
MPEAYYVKLPDVGEGVTEAEIVAWHVAVGDQVEEEQTLLDVMTDKATVEMPSPVAGKVMAIHGAVGDFAAVGSVLVEIATEGAVQHAARQEEAAPISTAKDAAEPSVESPVVLTGPVAPTRQAVSAPAPAVSISAFASRGAGDAPLAAPATRRRAFEHGVPLQFVPGTGPGGRIIPSDLDAYMAHGVGEAGPAQGLMPREGVHETKIVGLRRVIAQRMQDAKSRIPHFSYIEEFDVTALEGLRKELNQERASDDQPKLTLLPFFMRALVLLQPEFPNINARYDDEANVLHAHDGVHIGIATQTPQGLMVPVVRHAEARDLWACAREMVRVTAAARSGAAARDELTGSTITLTSLGALGGIAATPVINSPEVAIIGPNKIVERPIVQNGQIVIRTMMNLSTSFDHRIVDGHDAARFVGQLKMLIEQPARLFVEMPR